MSGARPPPRPASSLVAQPACEHVDVDVDVDVDVGPGDARSHDVRVLPASRGADSPAFHWAGP